LPGRKPPQAWADYLGPMNKALQCISRERFLLLEKTAHIEANTTYSAALNEMNSVPLKSDDGIHLVAGQTIQIYEWKPKHPQQRYRVKTLSYIYGFTQKTRDSDEEVEMLSFHWDRERIGVVRYPLGHLHIGPGLLANPTPIRLGDFHNAHIPTERVSFEAVVRFAIVELGVQPLFEDWEPRLKATETAFLQYKTV
jgi:hypothetical protein